MYKIMGEYEGNLDRVMKKYLGMALIALPFIVVFIGGIYMIGILGTVVVFSLTILVLAILWSGVRLMIEGEL